MRTAAAVFALIAGVFASLVLLDLVSILVLAPSMGIGTGEIVWRVALVVAGVCSP